MWLQKIKHPLSAHVYALYPLITIITVIILSCRISAMSRAHKWHKIPSPWTTIVSFGDNFSDSGNGAHITGGKYPSGPWSWHHRFTNGPNWIDNLILDLGGVGKIHMRNFAHGGASTDNTLVQGNLLDHTIPGTHQQVRGFMLKTRQTGYPKSNSTLYTIWTGANDCLALGGVGSLKPDRKFQVSDIEESMFQDVLQLERDSHNKVTNVLILTPPPAEDMPMVKHDKPNAHATVRQATASLARNLPHTLFEKFSTLGRATITDNVRLGPLQPPTHLPNHRIRATYPITHYITVDLPHNYDHLLPHEHNGTHPVAPSTSASGPPLHPHPVPSIVAGPGHPPVKLHKRSAVTSSVGHAVPSTAAGGGATRLRIMVYDAYGFIKHAEENPLCYGFNPAMMNKTCGEQPHCHDRVWIDDSNVGTGVHYWMARDINTRLHMWHMHNAGINLERFFKNSTRAKELELEMLGFSCPMHAAPTDF
ncbi:hypothetical protein EV178_002187 [Coemansia sp. RSA 1646]|nr:hypothetical protein EV178_002187 [Coemansia sp. RSA 1646]KAJ2215503.1 hypothetical protein EV179_002096 [Coemansia sp. RSA 487]